MLSWVLLSLGLPDSSLGLLHLPVYLSTVGFWSCFYFWFSFLCFAFPLLLPHLAFIFIFVWFLCVLWSLKVPKAPLVWYSALHQCSPLPGSFTGPFCLASLSQAQLGHGLCKAQLLTLSPKVWNHGLPAPQQTPFRSRHYLPVEPYCIKEFQMHSLLLPGSWPFPPVHHEALSSVALSVWTV